MLDVFIGQHKNKIDSKWRLSIPADFRKVIDMGDRDRDPGEPASFLLVYGDERVPYLQGMTMTRLRKITRQIRKMKRADPRRMQLEEMIYENAQTFVIDPNGRIVLPERGREKLGLSADDIVVFAGRGDLFRLSKAEKAAAAPQRPAAMPEWGYDPDTDPMEYIDGDDEDDEEF